MNKKQICKFGEENRNIKNHDGVSLFTAPDNKQMKQGDIISIQVLKYANRTHPIYGKLLIDEKYFSNLIKNFDSNVRKDEIPINKEHDRTVAQAWIKKLYSKDDELFADIELTAEGAMNLNSKHYKYFSAEIADSYQDPDTNKWYNNVLVGGAFTNYPYFNGMEKIVASDPSEEDIKKSLSVKKSNSMNLKELLQSFAAKTALSFSEKALLIKTYNEATEEEQKEVEKEVETAVEKTEEKVDEEKEEIKKELSNLKAEKQFSDTKVMFSTMNAFNQKEDEAQTEAEKVLKIFSTLNTEEAKTLHQFFSKFEAVIETLTQGQLSKSFAKKASVKEDGDVDGEEGDKKMSKDGKKEVISEWKFTKICQDYAEEKNIDFNKAYDKLKDKYEIEK